MSIQLYAHHGRKLCSCAFTCFLPDPFFFPRCVKQISFSKCARDTAAVRGHVCDLVRHSSGIARRTSCRFRECGNEPWGYNKTAPKQRERRGWGKDVGTEGRIEEKERKACSWERREIPRAASLQKKVGSEWGSGEEIGVEGYPGLGRT